MFKNMKLSVKLVTLFLLIGVLPAAIIGIISLTTASKDILLCKHSYRDCLVDNFVLVGNIIKNSIRIAIMKEALSITNKYGFYSLTIEKGE